MGVVLITRPYWQLSMFPEKPGTAEIKDSLEKNLPTEPYFVSGLFLYIIFGTLHDHS